MNDPYPSYEAEREAIVEALKTMPAKEGEMIPYALGDRIRWIIQKLVAAQAELETLKK